MVLSMTGYGRAEQERSGRDITVEIKSVNSRYFEYTSRMPRSFAFLDDKLKKLVNATISRGKTELALTVVNIGAPEASISVNLDLAKGYLDAIGEMSSALGVENDVTAGTLTRFSDIFTTRKAETDEEQLWADVKAVAEAAVENFVAMRAAEGEKLRADILSRLVYLEQAVGEIEQTSAERVQKYTEKLYAKLKALLEDTNIDEARIGRGDGPPAQPHPAVSGHSGEERAGGSQAGFPDAGAEPGNQYHRKQGPGACDHTHGGGYESGDREDTRADPEHRMTR